MNMRRLEIESASRDNSLVAIPLGVLSSAPPRGVRNLTSQRDRRTCQPSSRSSRTLMGFIRPVQLRSGSPFNKEMNTFMIPSSISFLATSYSNTLEEHSMGDIIFKKGSIWYVHHTHQGVLIRRSLKTSDKEKAIKRFIALINAVEDGSYQFYSAKFDDLVKKYDPQIDRKNKLMNLRNHLIPEFAGKRLHEINIQAWAEKIAAKYVKSTAEQIMRPATEMGFQIDYKAFKFIPGRVFDSKQIPDEELIFAVFDELQKTPRSRKYYPIARAAAYSGMPMSDLLHLTKAQVVFTGPDDGISYIRRKTRHKKQTELFVPMSKKLHEAFRVVPTPLFNEANRS